MVATSRVVSRAPATRAGPTYFCHWVAAGWVVGCGTVEVPALALNDFNEILSIYRELPDTFVRDVVMKATSKNMMNNRVSIHILTNARSGNCSQDCAYCAQSCRSKADIEKYKCTGRFG